MKIEELNEATAYDTALLNKMGLKQEEAEYHGRKVTLNKPMAGDVKKFKVYVRHPETGNIIKVNFGDKEMKIKKRFPKRRASFRARHKCDETTDYTTPRFWSCVMW